MVTVLRKLSVRHSLSMQLLLLTVAFVLLAEVLIYVPSVVNFRQSWLEERLAAAGIAILALEAAPDYMVSEKLTRKLLNNAQVVAISLKKADKRQLVINTDHAISPTAHYDMRRASYWVMLKDTFKTLFHSHPHGTLIQVTGYTDFMPGDDWHSIEIIFRENILCDDMNAFSLNVMIVSIIISLITAGLVYVSLSYMLVRPIKRLTRSIIAFRQSPEKSCEVLSGGRRKDEIGLIFREISLMQEDIQKALAQKKNLARLGESVSKISHDLRNILASAQMVSDHLKTVDNPVVQKLAPRFVAAVDRAIRLCENALKYGTVSLEKPVLMPVNLHYLLDEVGLSLGLFEQNRLRYHNAVPEGFIVTVDEGQMFRVFLNLCRNAVQAMKDGGDITITARREPAQEKTVIDIIDNGPGIPLQIQDKLFQPFHGSANGGAGLGLAIAQEILEAHSGVLTLVNADDSGTHFRIIL